MIKIDISKNRKIFYPIIILFAIAFLFAGNRAATTGYTLFEDDSDTEIARAVVRSITGREDFSREYDESTTVRRTDIYFRAVLRSGTYSGRTVEAFQVIDDFTYVAPKEVEAGDTVLLAFNPSESEKFDWMFLDYIRSDKLMILGIVFFVLLIVFGRKKGFNTILSLIFTCLAIFAVFIPSVFSGKNIYLWSIMTCIYVILTTMLIIGGVNRKTLAAIIGCFSGIAMAGLLTVAMDRILFLTGFLDEHSMHIVNLPLDNPVDLKAIVFAAIIIGAMGAIMDVSVSIASSLWEIRNKVESCSFKTLYRSGINIGKDIMGTMSNTLILAYIGGALSLVLLLSAYSSSMIELFNREMIITEILKALVGSLGILLTMPLTSIVCAFLYTDSCKNLNKKLKV